MHESGDVAFERKLLNRAFSNPKFVYGNGKQSIRHVFLSIDPNAGGDSRFAVCSCFYDHGKMVICGLDAVKSKNPSMYETVLIRHIRALRKREQLRSAVFVLLIENNLGFESYHIERFIKKSEASSFCCFLRDDKEQRVGLRTTNIIKESMWRKFRTFLEEDAVFVWQDMVSVQYTVREILKQMKEELQNYKVITELPKTIFQQTKRTFTGKHGGGLDDLSVTVQLNALWHGEFWTQRYSEFH
jgi:hypothetical protein